jgi:hypothetical protein
MSPMVLGDSYLHDTPTPGGHLLLAFQIGEQSRRLLDSAGQPATGYQSTPPSRRHLSACAVHLSSCARVAQRRP